MCIRDRFLAALGLPADSGLVPHHVRMSPNLAGAIAGSEFTCRNLLDNRFCKWCHIDIVDESECADFLFDNDSDDQPEDERVDTDSSDNEAEDVVSRQIRLASERPHGTDNICIFWQIPGAVAAPGRTIGTRQVGDRGQVSLYNNPTICRKHTIGDSVIHFPVQPLCKSSFKEAILATGRDTVLRVLLRERVRTTGNYGEPKLRFEWAYATLLSALYVQDGREAVELLSLIHISEPTRPY